MSPIDDYLDEIRHGLQGPRRAREDLLHEAADHLTDAVCAYVEAGMDCDMALERAVSEFGPAAYVAAGFQEEMDLAQASRTALATVIGVGIQPLIWNVLWPLSGQATVTVPAPLHGAVIRLVEAIGALAILFAALGAIASRIGIRYPVVRHNVVKLIGVLGLVVAVSMSASALFLTAVSPDPTRFLEMATMPSLALFLLLPMAWIGQSARQCLRQRVDLTPHRPRGPRPRRGP